jgi:large subunit ribosomal protein L14e
MMNIGRVCIKLAGRDAGKRCVVVNVIDDNRVLIDGETRRRPCNLRHLEPTAQVIEISADAGHEEVVRALGIPGTTSQAKQKTEKPRRQRKAKVAPQTSSSEQKPKEKKQPVKKTAKPAKKAATKQE